MTAVSGVSAFSRVRVEGGGGGPGRGLALIKAANALASVLRLRSGAGADSPAPDILASVLRLRGAGAKGKKSKKVSKPSVNLNFATSLAAEGKREAGGDEKDGKAGTEEGDEAKEAKEALDMSEIKASLVRLEGSLPVVTGVLATHEGSRDIKIDQFTLEVCCCFGRCCCSRRRSEKCREVWGCHVSVRVVMCSCVTLAGLRQAACY